MKDAHVALIALLSRPRAAWKTLSGRVANGYNETLLDVGRRQWHSRDKDGPNASDTATLAEPIEFEEEKARFWAMSSPFRLRVERVLDTSPDSGPYRTVVVNGSTWWAFDGGPCVTNAGDARYETGTFNLRTLLFPTGVLKAFKLDSARHAEIEGRRVIEARAIPQKAFFRELPEIVVLSSDDYRLYVDEQTGILVRWIAFIHGQLAREGALSAMEVDAEIRPELFLPPPGENPLPPSEWPREEHAS